MELGLSCANAIVLQVVDTFVAFPQSPTRNEVLSDCGFVAMVSKWKHNEVCHGPCPFKMRYKKILRPIAKGFTMLIDEIGTHDEIPRPGVGIA
jgi:hypothetical protein